MRIFSLILGILMLAGCGDLEPKAYTFFCGAGADGIVMAGRLIINSDGRGTFVFKTERLRLFGSLSRCMIMERSD